MTGRFQSTVGPSNGSNVGRVRIAYILVHIGSLHIAVQSGAAFADGVFGCCRAHACPPVMANKRLSEAAVAVSILFIVDLRAAFWM